MDYHGADLKKGFRVRGPLKCCEACQQDARCAFWTYGKDNGKCWIKHSSDGIERQRNRIAGTIPEHGSS